MKRGWVCHVCWCSIIPNVNMVNMQPMQRRFTMAGSEDQITSVEIKKNAYNRSTDFKILITNLYVYKK